MTQDYSVEVLLPEQPDPPAPAGRMQRAGADEVADGGGRAVAQIRGRLEGGEVRRSHFSLTINSGAGQPGCGDAVSGSELGVFASNEGAGMSCKAKRRAANHRRRCAIGGRSLFCELCRRG